MKHLLIGLAIMIVAILSLMIGFKLLSRHIYNRTDCERFNIDNIELRTGINVPVVDEITCNCGDGYKQASFVLDTNHVDLKEYVLENNFELQAGVYKAQGDNERTKWEASVNPATNLLSFQIEYKAFATD